MLMFVWQIKCDNFSVAIRIFFDYMTNFFQHVIRSSRREILIRSCYDSRCHRKFMHSLVNDLLILSNSDQNREWQHSSVSLRWSWDMRWQHSSVQYSDLWECRHKIKSFDILFVFVRMSSQDQVIRYHVRVHVQKNDSCFILDLVQFLKILMFISSSRFADAHI
jgi:hypothetical protein